MNSFGKLFSVSLFGESHGNSIGVLITGAKPGIKVDYDLIAEMLERRKPNYIGSTPRKEKDEYMIESGVDQGYTTGTPILVRITNQNIKKKDYDEFKDIYRPSHSDFVAFKKYEGFNNLPGSGHFSGRITVGLVIAGAFAKMHTKHLISSEFLAVGDLKDINKLDSYLTKIVEEEDSIGAIIKLTVKNVEIGLGEPFFGGADSTLASALYSVPAVKGVSFGAGFKGISMLGSEFNDVFINEEGKTLTNNSGGISGGITNGNDLIVNVFIKPASSISKEQKTFNFTTKKMDSLKIKGRHDSFIAKRAVVVLESVIYIALCDLMMQKRSRK